MAREIRLGNVYIGDRPIEDLTAEEREAFDARCAERMGRAINDYYSCHPEELEQLVTGMEWDRNPSGPAGHLQHKAPHCGSGI